MAININDIIKQWQDQQTAANEKNEQRYQQILGMYGDTGGASLMDLVGQLGKSEMRAIGTGEQQAKASAEQGLIGRGLGNTTARAGEMRNISNMAELSRQKVGESQVEKLMGVKSAQAQMMASRTDQGPNSGLFASLIQSASAQPGTDAQTGRATGLSGGGGRSQLIDGSWRGGGKVDPGNDPNSLWYKWATGQDSGSSGGGGGGGGGLPTAMAGGSPPSGFTGRNSGQQDRTRLALSAAQKSGNIKRIKFLSGLLGGGESNIDAAQAASNQAAANLRQGFMQNAQQVGGPFMQQMQQGGQQIGKKISGLFSPITSLFGG